MKSVFLCFSKKITQQAPTRLNVKHLIDLTPSPNLVAVDIL